MPRTADRAALSRLALAVLFAACYALTIFIFYPGVMTYDAKFVYEDIAKGVLGDWQSPVMTVLWAVIDPLAPGPGSMFLLIATSYWLGFALLAFTLARRRRTLSLIVPLLALLPPAFVFVGVIWRDVLFATSWLLAAAMVFAVAGQRTRLRVAVQGLALTLCVFGVLLRPNALVAAPILAAYLVWPDRVRLKRYAILFLPALAASFLLLQVIYYGVLGVTRQHPLQSVMVFDLGGITHFAKKNVFPVTWNGPETALILNGCYQPTHWDIYWRLEPCDFVMQRLEKTEKLFGTPAITVAWLHAVLAHPIAYLEHRAAFMWNFLARQNLTMWLADIEQPEKTVFSDHRAFVALQSIHDMLKATVLFRAGTWLLLCEVVCGAAWRWRDTREGAFAIGLCAAAAVYVLTFFGAGVASDFRYAYVAVLAAIAGGITTATRWST